MAFNRVELPMVDKKIMGVVVFCPLQLRRMRARDKRALHREQCSGNISNAVTFYNKVFRQQYPLSSLLDHAL